MSIISEKVAYLKGLTEGMKIDASTNEGKLLTEIISVLGDIADDIEYLEDSQDELFDKVFDLEDDVDELYESEYDGYDDEDYDPLVVTCPNCEEEFFVDEDDLDSMDPIECPNCGQEIELEIECDCEECDDDNE